MRPDAIVDAEPFRVAPMHLPKLLRRTPDRPEAPGAPAKVSVAPGNPHGDDFVVYAAHRNRTRFPGDGLDDEFNGLETQTAFRSYRQRTSLVAVAPN